VKVVITITRQNSPTIKQELKMASHRQDVRLNKFVVPQKKAGVYVFRNQIKGNILIIDLVIDSQ